jgi:8-oxo-dGTP pyrophosphatase MutT (NUDIX family)
MTAVRLAAVPPIDEVRRRIAAASANPGIRRNTGRLVRGDHDLNPDLKPKAPLLPASVLVPLVDRPEGLSVLLTRRTSHLSAHAGQISFPGGRVDPGDSDAVAAALRETREEVGLTPDLIEILGRLDTYHVRTGFEVTPVVGLLRPPFTLTLDSFEVAEAFEVPLGFILDPANHQRQSRTENGQERYFWAMPYGDHFIWGATAGMLLNLYEILGR